MPSLSYDPATDREIYPGTKNNSSITNRNVSLTLGYLQKYTEYLYHYNDTVQRIISYIQLHTCSWFTYEKLALHYLASCKQLTAGI